MKEKILNIFSGAAIGVGTIAIINFLLLRKIDVYRIKEVDKDECSETDWDMDPEYDCTFSVPHENLLHVPAEILAGKAWDKFVKANHLNEKKILNACVAVLAVSTENEEISQPSSTEMNPDSSCSKHGEKSDVAPISAKETEANNGND